MKSGPTPSSRFLAGIGLWMAAVLSVLALTAGVSFLQVRLNLAAQPGLGALAGLLFYVYGPFFLSGFCGLLFAPAIACPFRGVLSAKGFRPVLANAIAGALTVIGAFTSYHLVL